MSEFRRLVIEYLEEEDRREIEEGKLGKFLGTMATAAAIGLGGMGANPAMGAQYNPNNEEQVLAQKFFGQANTPEWVKDSGKLTVDNGKLYFVNEIIRPETSRNTAQLERVAGMEGGAKLLSTMANAVNNNIDGSMNKIGNNFTISSMVPQGSWWLLLQDEDGPEYHVFSKIRVDQAQIEKSLTNALQKANPKANSAKIKQVVKSAMNSVMAK